MPAILDRLVSQLKAEGMDEKKAWAIANSQLQKHGIFKKGTRELTAHGKVRNEMSPAQRAIDRQARYEGKPRSAFKYDPKTNKATLKGK